MVVRDDLVSLRDFLKQGMQFSVVEEMVGTKKAMLSYEIYFLSHCVNENSIYLCLK